MSKTTNIHSGLRSKPTNFGNFRKAEYTIPGHLQLVYSTLKKEESTTFASIKSSQVIITSSGNGNVIVQYPKTKDSSGSQKIYPLRRDLTVIVPAGLNHSLLNAGDVPLNMEIIYSPPLVSSDYVEKTAKMVSNASMCGKMSAEMCGMVQHSASMSGKVSKTAHKQILDAIHSKNEKKLIDLLEKNYDKLSSSELSDLMTDSTDQRIIDILDEYYESKN